MICPFIAPRIEEFHHFTTVRVIRFGFVGFEQISSSTGPGEIGQARWRHPNFEGEYVRTNRFGSKESGDWQYSHNPLARSATFFRSAGRRSATSMPLPREFQRIHQLVNRLISQPRQLSQPLNPFGCVIFNNLNHLGNSPPRPSLKVLQTLSFPEADGNAPRPTEATLWIIFSIRSVSRLSGEVRLFFRAAT